MVEHGQEDLHVVAVECRHSFNLSKKLKGIDFFRQKIRFNIAAIMQGIQRRVVYVSLYELIAIAVSSVLLALVSGQGTGHASVAAVAASVIAIIWNIVFNTLFERWEARQAVRGRNVWRRVAHAVGFEGGLVLVLVPMFAWWFGVSLWEAFWLEAGLILFFLIYTFVFNLAFDKVFGLRASAQ